MDVAFEDKMWRQLPKAYEWQQTTGVKDYTFLLVQPDNSGMTYSGFGCAGDYVVAVAGGLILLTNYSVLLNNSYFPTHGS